MENFLYKTQTKMTTTMIGDNIQLHNHQQRES